MGGNVGKSVRAIRNLDGNEKPDPSEDALQGILACLQRIECILKDEEAERIRARKEMRDYQSTVRSIAAPKEDEQCL